MNCPECEEDMSKDSHVEFCDIIRSSICEVCHLDCDCLEISEE